MRYPGLLLDLSLVNSVAYDFWPVQPIIAMRTPIVRKPMSTIEGRKAFLHFAHCLNNRDLLEIEAELRSLDIPVLVIRGQADPYLSAAISERLVRELPDARLVLIPTGGHYLMIDEPELVVKEILGFVGQTRA